MTFAALLNSEHMQQRAESSPSFRSLLSTYRPQAGSADELIDAQGQVRRVWRPFLSYLARLNQDELAERFARGDQYLQDAGVFFRLYSDEGSTERDWPLSHIPVLVEEQEWRGICQGLIQRAELLEQVLADLYGENRLVQEGYLPSVLVAQNPEWLRPMVGIEPRGGHFLHFLAFELGRGPDGVWWVLGDRSQAPSGAGFALENRVATARVFSDFFANANVHRLANFFRQFREALQAHQSEKEGRVAILTPGPLNESYFEHAYIARYLGFMLLEGEDLTVENGQLLVRTVAGLKPLSILWRRLDASFADPLELHEHSHLGTPGLVNVLRQGNVTLVNALGSGILETRALLAFLPRIARHLLGEELKLPNIATWWCGQTSEREHVLAHLNEMTLSGAFATGVPFEMERVPEGPMPRPEHGVQARSEWLKQSGRHLVGQEAVTLSTTPAHLEGALVPRPMTLRVFLARTPQGWQVMPGGYARIGKTADPAAIAMQQGGSVADVWIVSEKPVEAYSLVSSAEKEPYQRIQFGVLPSRAADNLFWLGRYVERTEGLLRLLRAYHLRLAETDNPESPLLTHITEHLTTYGVQAEEVPSTGLVQAIQCAVFSAGKVRDRFSVDGWIALKDLSEDALRLERQRVLGGDVAARKLGQLLRQSNAFSGLVHENMYRFTGWRFLAIGRSLERASMLAGALAHFADPAAPEGALELMVEIGDSAMTHRRRYWASTIRETVVDLLACDLQNPRSLHYHVTVLRDQIAQLPHSETNGVKSRLLRSTIRVHTQLATATPDELNSEALRSLRSQFWELSDQLTQTYLH